ncbi:MAG TPA: hypothetical protein VK171_07615 [Fimbriimonas sp.]|nr:hypothetical protein [Fimbriimonas sp.]
MKKVVVVFGVALAGLAVAASFVRAKGSGVVTNPAGKKAEFVMDVWKQVTSSSESVGGNAKFGTSIRSESGQEGRRYIELRRVVTVSHSGRTVVAYGRGVMQIVFPNRPIVLTEGYVRVAVEDRKTPNGPGDLDKYSIRFQPQQTGPVFEFGGLVRPGDVAVLY